MEIRTTWECQRDDHPDSTIRQRMKIGQQAFLPIWLKTDDDDDYKILLHRSLKVFCLHLFAKDDLLLLLLMYILILPLLGGWRTLGTASLVCRSSNIKIDISSSSSSSQAIVELAVNGTALLSRVCDVVSDRRLLLFEQSWSNNASSSYYYNKLTVIVQEDNKLFCILAFCISTDKLHHSAQ